MIRLLRSLVPLRIRPYVTRREILTVFVWVPACWYAGWLAMFLAGVPAGWPWTVLAVAGLVLAVGAAFYLRRCAQRRMAEESTGEKP